MSYARLMRDHAAIEELIAALLRAVEEGQAADASAALERLAGSVRDHRVAETSVLAATLELAAGNRHAIAAVRAMRDLDAAEEVWTHYLYRWPPAAVAQRWAAFGEETRTIMPALRGELAREGGILYSLAVHYALLATVD